MNTARHLPSHHRVKSHHSGFALVAVVWVVAVVALIAAELLASIGSEARMARSRLEMLQAARLADGGHEVAEYLRLSGLLVANADLGTIPVTALDAGRRYRIEFAGGTADIDFESENGLYSLNSAPAAALANLFSLWRGDGIAGERMAQSVADWRDSNRLNPNGAPEALDYPNAPYEPRNRSVGVGDAHLIAGFSPADFEPRIVNVGAEAWVLPAGLYSVFTLQPTGSQINPNYASAPALASVEGITLERVDRILELRSQEPFQNRDDFALRLGLDRASPLANGFAFDNGSGPAVRVVGRLRTGTNQYDRRAYQVETQYRPETGTFEEFRTLRTRGYHPITATRIETP